MTRVSIITPSYNQAMFLEKTILSVLGQNYVDLEYIIVDGGSTDGSAEIIEKYAHQLAWWVSESDQGQADAINKGFRRATGEIIAWLNSDDLYAPGAIKRSVSILDDNPDLGMVYGNAVTFDQDGQPLNDLIFGDWGLAGLMAFQIICQPAVFMRRSVLEEAGYLDTSYHYLLDHELWLRMAQTASIQHVPELWAFARHHADAKNVAHADGFGKEAYRILGWLKTKPDMAAILDKNRNSIEAAAARFDARYLLDGGRAWAALKSYGRSLRLHPATALMEWHRIIFSMLSVLGLGRLGELYYRAKRLNNPVLTQALGIDNVDQLYQVN
ncbi:MAG: glycosyltransferase family 2 protein [Chloroflexota bacterium]